MLTASFDLESFRGHFFILIGGCILAATGLIVEWVKGKYEKLGQNGNKNRRSVELGTSYDAIVKF